MSGLVKEDESLQFFFKKQRVIFSFGAVVLFDIEVADL